MTDASPGDLWEFGPNEDMPGDGYDYCKGAINLYLGDDREVCVYCPWTECAEADSCVGVEMESFSATLKLNPNMRKLV